MGEIETGAGEKREKKIGRETGVRESKPQKKRHMVGERKIRRGGREREREPQRGRRRDKGERKIKRGDMNGSRRGRRQGWERER